MEYTAWLRNKDLEYKDGILCFANLNTIEIAEKYGTPIYVINEEMIRKRYRDLKKSLDSLYERNTIYFAVKANSSLSVLKILYSEGASFDCTSTGEIHECFKVGIPPEKIFFTGNMFTNEDLKFAVENNVHINLDSISQLRRLNKVYDDFGFEKQAISFRINPEFGAGHHSHTITAGKLIKFGILEDQVIEAYSLAKDLGFKKYGTHIHIGSGIINAYDYEKAVEKYFTIVTHLTDVINIKLEFIDFGGGLGIPYRPEEDPLDLGIYKDIVIEKFKKLVERGDLGEPRFIIEPGRYLSAESSIILAQINTVKDNGFKKFAGINAGFNTLIRPTMYGSYHHIIPCLENQERDTIKYDVVGPICESGDIIGKERILPKLEEEEFLAILDTGAYGFVMSSLYNSRPRPAEILISNGKIFKIREEETFDDLFRNQIIPKHLE
ncbi:MAG: diaminopimelate decarboxylase [Candidatus Lokiarchaeota archaeon]|nr:diaminopimelate decarboxylase [Candidatus Lokiarchaeota archaeon]